MKVDLNIKRAWKIRVPAFAEPALMKMGGQAYFVTRNDTRTFIYKGFRKNMGTGFTFCLTLNARGQKKTVPILNYLFRNAL